MQLALRPYVTAGVAVIGASLIQVTPLAAPDIGQRAVELAAAGDVIDLVGPVDAAVNSLGGGAGSLVDSVTDTLTSGIGASSAEFGSVLPSLADMGLPPYLDPAFWELFWNTLFTDPINAWFGLIGALASIPVIGPIFGLVGVVSFFLPLALAAIWSQIEQLLGLEPFPAAAEGLGTGLQDVYDAALSGVIDPALPAGAATALGDSTVLDDVTSLFSGAAGVLDPTTLVEDPSTVLDPSALTSILDPGAIGGLDTGFDPAEVADIGTLLSTNPIPDLDLIP